MRKVLKRMKSEKEVGPDDKSVEVGFVNPYFEKTSICLFSSGLLANSCWIQDSLVWGC